MKMRSGNGKTFVDFLITDRELETILKNGRRTDIQKTDPNSKDFYWLSFEVPRLLHVQYRLWCKLRGVDPQENLSAVLLNAMATDDMGKTHLEAVGPHDRHWKRVAKKAGWEMTDKGTLKRKR